LNIVIVQRFGILSALHSKTSSLQLLLDSSHKQSPALVVAVADVLVADVLAVVSVVVALVAIALVAEVLAVVSVVVALVAAVVLVVKTAQVIISRRVHRTRVLQATHVQEIVLATHVPQATHVLRVLLIPVLRVLLIPVQHALEIHVRPLAHVLPNPKLVVNVEISAVANHGLPSSSQFFLESSRFR
jgi:hypothetical protein